MNKVSLNLNERTQSVPIFNTVNDLLSKYYESTPEDSEIEKYGLLHDTYFLIKELFNIVGCRYDDETQLLLANYIYRHKGSIKSIYELFRVLWGDYAGGISNSPGYSIKYKYSVKGYNDLFSYKNENGGKKFDAQNGTIDSSDVFPVNIYATSSDPLELYYPLILPNDSSIKSYITQPDIEDFIIVEKIKDEKSLDTIIESVDSIPIKLEDVGTEININIEAKKTIYTSNNEIEYVYLFNQGNTTKSNVTKITKTFSKDAPGGVTFSDDHIISSEKTEISKEDGSIDSRIINVYKNGSFYKKEIILNKDSIQTYYYTTEVVSSTDETKSINYLKSLGYSLSGDTYTEITTKTGTRSSDDVLNDKNLDDGEEENVVSFDLYEDGSLKEKTTTQTVYDLKYNEVITKVINIDGVEVNSISELSVSRTPRIIDRKYKIKPPQKKKLAVGLRQIFKSNSSNDLESFYYHSGVPRFEIPYDGEYLDKENDVNLNNYIYKKEDLNKILDISSDINHNLGDVYILIKSRISSSDTEDSREAQKTFWKSGSDKNEKSINIGKFSIKTKAFENGLRNELTLIDSSNIEDKNEKLAVKNYIRPHVEVKYKILPEESSANVLASNISKNFLSYIKYTDARELEININFTGKNKDLFTKVLEELIRDLLFISKKGNNSYMMGSINDDSYEYFPAIDIKINTTIYNIDSEIKLRNSTEVRQINNIIPKKYISEGKLLWMSKY